MRAAWLLVVGAACGHAVSPASQVVNRAPAPASAPATVPHAFVSDSTGLVEVTDAQHAKVVTKIAFSQCNVDARAQVVWLLGDDGLSTYDLVDQRVHKVAAGPIDAEQLVIDWGSDGQLGNDDQLDYHVGVAIHMTATPKLSSVIGCDGDSAVYCYVDNGGSDPQVLVPDLAAKAKALDALTIADPPYVAQLAARGAGRRLTPPMPNPPAKPANAPKIDKAACIEQPENCGAMTWLPGTSLWLVVTSNDRGDFFHQTRVLWDAASGQFFSLAPGKIVHTVAPVEADQFAYNGIEIATNGLMSNAGMVFDASTGTVIYAPVGEGGSTCGWSNGSWGVPLFTD